MSAQPPAAEQAHRLRNQAVEHIRANRPRQARDALEALIRIQPQDVPACLELANLMSRQGQFRASSEPLMTAMRHLPRNGPILLTLAAELIARGEVVSARACLDFLAQDAGAPAQALEQQGRLRYGMGEFGRARELFRRALDAGGDTPDLHLVHALMLEFTGEVDAARQALESCIARWPGYGDAAVALIRRQRQTAADNRLDYVEAQLRALPVTAQEASTRLNRAAFEYARFKVLDDLGRPAEAWPSLARSNALMRELYPYDAESEAALTRALVEAPPVRPAAHRALPAAQGPMPIFIVGLPRSGSTLLERMLSAHSRAVSAGELHDFEMQLHWVADVRPGGVQGLRRIAEHIDDVDFAEVGRRYLEQTRWRAAGSAFYVDKMPANIRMVAYIRRALPQARILNMVRAPMDLCFSNYKLFGNTSGYIHDLASIADYHRLHARLCARWHELSPDMMLDVSYASLVREPRATMQRVLDYCGLETEEACLHPERNASPVATPSTSQVREPIHTRGIGQWRTYATQLEPLRKALG